MKDFKSGDKVYCPALSTKPFLVYTKKDINGVFIKYRGKESWFTVNGLLDLSTHISNYEFKSIPSLFLATEETRRILCKLYDMDFKRSVDIPVYAINITFNGSATDDWVFWSQEGYYDWHSTGESTPSIPTLLHYDIFVSPSTEILKEVDLQGAHSKIICVGHVSIDKWCNPIT